MRPFCVFATEFDYYHNPIGVHCETRPDFPFWLKLGYLAHFCVWDGTMYRRRNKKRNTAIFQENNIFAYN